MPSNDDKEEGVILIRLSLDEEEESIELSVLDNTVEDSLASNVLSPIATGVVVLLEEEPHLLYDAGNGAFEGDVFVNTSSNVKH